MFQFRASRVLSDASMVHDFIWFLGRYRGCELCKVKKPDPFSLSAARAVCLNRQLGRNDNFGGVSGPRLLLMPLTLPFACQVSTGLPGTKCWLPFGMQCCSAGRQRAGAKYAVFNHHTRRNLPIGRETCLEFPPRRMRVRCPPYSPDVQRGPKIQPPR